MMTPPPSANPYYERRPEPFPKTRLEPSGWNFEAPRPKVLPVDPVHNPEMSAFPEPITMPKGWDLSGLLH